MKITNSKKLLTDPDSKWEAKYVANKVSHQSTSFFKHLLSTSENLIDAYTHPRSLKSLSEILQCIKHLIDEDLLGRQAVVIGCGPRPETIKDLVGYGFKVVGVEPVDAAMRQASIFLRDTATVVKGSAEQIPLDDGSQSLVLMENV